MYIYIYIYIYIGTGTDIRIVANFLLNIFSCVPLKAPEPIFFSKKKSILENCFFFVKLKGIPIFSDSNLGRPIPSDSKEVVVIPKNAISC